MGLNVRCLDCLHGCLRVKGRKAGDYVPYLAWIVRNYSVITINALLFVIASLCLNDERIRSHCFYLTKPVC